MEGARPEGGGRGISPGTGPWPRRWRRGRRSSAAASTGARAPAGEAFPRSCTDHPGRCGLLKSSCHPRWGMRDPKAKKIPSKRHSTPRSHYVKFSSFTSAYPQKGQAQRSDNGRINRKLYIMYIIGRCIRIAGWTALKSLNSLIPQFCLTGGWFRGPKTPFRDRRRGRWNVQYLECSVFVIQFFSFAVPVPPPQPTHHPIPILKLYIIFSYVKKPPPPLQITTLDPAATFRQNQSRIVINEPP